jgi:hypothetical protein
MASFIIGSCETAVENDIDAISLKSGLVIITTGLTLNKYQRLQKTLEETTYYKTFYPCSIA